MGMVGIGALAIPHLARARTMSNTAGIAHLARRIRAKYPNFASDAASAPGPRPWPHPGQKRPEELLRVDGWLLPASAATWILRQATS